MADIETGNGLGNLWLTIKEPARFAEGCTN